MAGSRNNHISEQRLWDLARGDLDPEAERHVASCAGCQHEFDTLQHLARFLTTTGGAMSNPPASLRAGLTDLFSQVRPDLVARQPSLLDQVRDVVRRVTADLILDTGVTPQVTGLRSRVDRRTRQLAFVSDVADLDLEVTPSDGASFVAGQLGMDTTPTGLVIRFVPTDQNVGEAVEAFVSDSGHFTIDVPGGEWEASVRMDDVVLQFPGIQL